MKKIFSLFAAVLMAGSLMAKDAAWIKFETVQSAEEVAGSTYGSDGFTLEIPDTSDKATVDANNCTFGVSDEDKIQFTHRLKTGGASSKDGRIFTLNIPEEGPLAIYARTSSKDATNRSFWIGDGADTIAYHICLDTDTVEGASSKIFLPVIVENVPAGSYKITYNNGINFYGFQMGVEETEETVDAELLCNLTFPGHNDKGVSSYSAAWTATVNGATWNIVNFNNNNNGWNLIKCGSKSAASVASITTPDFKANVTAIVYDFAAVASVDSAFLITLNGANEIAKTSVTLAAGKDSFDIADGQSKYSYKLEIYCAKASGNGPVQLSSVQVYGVPVQAAVADPVFDVAAGSYYDPQTIHLSCETEGAAILYTTDGTDPVLGSASVYYPQGIYLSAGTTTIKAVAYNNDSDNPEYSDVVEKTYTIATQYASLDELVAAGAPAGQKVVVTLTNETIDSLYVSSSNKTNGVYLTAGGRMVEIYCYNVPSTWAVGGTISGTVKGEWKEWQGTWEVCPSSWDGITYKAALPEGPAITVDVTAKTFSIVPANEGDIFMFMLLTPNMELPLSKETAIALAEENVSWIGADFTLEENVEEGYAYQEALVNIPFALIAEGGLANGKYAMAAFTLAEKDATLHTAKITSEVSYVEFTISDTSTAVDNTIETAKATKVVKDGQMMIIRDGKTYNVMGMQF